jgi:filamentous hemagglutinin
MAISIAQQVDLLYKQAFGVTKTDTANNKSPSNESIPSPLLIRGDTLWAQSDQIPAIAAATPGVVQAYTGASAVQMAADTTTVPVGGIYPTWLTNLTYWIPQEFGATYNIKIYIDNPGVANPTITGTQIFAAGSGGTGEFYYNYQSGVLNFIGGTIPAALTSGKVLYAVGYRYIGNLGVTDLPSNVTIGNMNFNNTTISTISGNANLILSPNGTGQVTTTASFTTSENVYANYGFFTNDVTANNFIANSTIDADGNITSNANIYAEYIVANADLLGVNVNASGSVTGENLNANVDLFVGGNANIGSGFAIFDSDNQELVIDGSIIPANPGYSLGNATNPWSGLYISGETIYIGGSTIKSSSTSNTLYFTNPTGANVAITGNSTTTTLSTVNLSANGNLNANFVNANSNVLANFINANANVYSSNVIVNLELSGNTANFTGNINSALNANLGNLVTANFINAASNITTGNLKVNLELAGNTANFTGNISAANGNMGNLLTANYVTTAEIYNGNSNVRIAANGNVTVSSEGNANVFTVTGTGANVSGTANITSDIIGGGNLNISGNALVTGNLTVDGNLVYVNVTDLAVQDPIIQLQVEPNGQPLTSNTGKDVGTALNYYDTSAKVAFMGWDVSNAEIGFGSQVSISSEVVTFTQYANIRAGNANLGNLVTANFASFTNNVAITLDLDANTANFSGLVDIDQLNVSNKANLGNVGNITIIGGSNAQFLQTDGTGNLTWATVDSSIIKNGNSNVSIPVANGNIEMSVAGNANIAIITGTGANVNGYLTVTQAFSGNTANFSGNVVVHNLTVNLELAGNTANFSGNITSLNANLGNLATANYVNVANNINVTATITSGNITVNSDLSGNTANFSGNVQVNNLDVNLELSGATANFSGNVIVPNLTVNLELDGNSANFNSATIFDFIASNTANLGNVGNVTITGGSANQFLQTNGSGALTWATVDSSIIKNGTSNVSIPVANGNIEMAVNGNANIAVITGTGANINGYLTVSQTLNGNVGSFSNGITGQNVYSNTTIDAVGNITGGNIKGNTDVVAGGNVIGASLYANYIYANATANILGDFRANANASVGLNLAGNTANFTGNVEVNNLDVNLALTGSTANFTGNVEVNNLDVNLELTGATANFTSNVTVNNLGVNLQLSGNTANFSGLVDIFNLNVSNTANLGNVANITITGGSNGQFLQTNGSGVVTWATVDTSIIANGNSNVSIPVANGNVEISVGGVADLFVISNVGANITGTLGVSSTITAANLTVNLELAGNTANFTGNVQVNNLDVNLELTGNTANFTGNVQVNNLDVNLQLDGNTANFTGNISAANAALGNLVTANYVNVASNTITSNLTVNLELAGNTANFSTSVQTPLINNGNSNIGITANGNIAISSAGTTNVFVVSSGGANITGDLGVSGNFSVGSLTATNLKANSNVEIGNTTITWGTITTTAVTANQTIAQFPVSGFAGIQFLVRGVDSTGSKYSVATVQAVTDGANVDYAIYGGVGLGGTTGTLAVNISGSNIALQVTPSSSNSTVWTTQYKLV